MDRSLHCIDPNRIELVKIFNAILMASTFLYNPNTSQSNLLISLKSLHKGNAFQHKDETEIKKIPRTVLRQRKVLLSKA